MRLLKEVARMGNIEHAKYIPLTEVPEVLPIRRRGKKLHVSTVWRWARKGVGHRTLMTWQIGGTTCTTMAAIEDFILSPGSLQSSVHDQQIEGSQPRGSCDGCRELKAIDARPAKGARDEN
jgi:hypothetical protein